MAKRFCSTEIWEEDWFLEMPNEYKLFWYYMLSNCDHAGVYKVNLRSFCSLLGVNVASKIALDNFNNGKTRVRQIAEGIWFIEEFFVFQYGTSFNVNNPLHRGVKKQWDKNGIELTSIRGLLDHTHTLKEKEKDIVLDKSNTNQVKKSENGNSKKQNGFIDLEAQRERTAIERIDADPLKTKFQRIADNR